MRAKLSYGRPDGERIVIIGDWDLRKTEMGFKVCAVNPVDGKANYSFGGKDNRIDKSAGKDAKKLRDDHPILCQDIDKYFQEHNVCPGKPDDNSDPFGDIAMSQRLPLQPDQQWRRGLLQMRRQELEHVALGTKSIWEAGIRMLHAGVFKEKISDSELQKSMAYVQKRSGAVSAEALLEVIREYYAGKYKPHACETLDAQMNMLAGDGGEFEDLI